MNKDEAKIVLLEDSLEQSYYTIRFLHECLTNEATYGYPVQTLDRLEKIAVLINLHEYCYHSFYNKGCPGCEEHLAWSKQKNEARKVLNECRI